MSEYQCYEFVALDGRLTATQMAELRAISTRAEISPTRFWNEYQWGDLKADPAKLTARYFDAHLYFANWGAHRLMLRLPKARVDAKALLAKVLADRDAMRDCRRSRTASGGPAAQALDSAELDHAVRVARLREVRSSR